MANKDIRIYVFGVHDPALLDKPHMWTTLKDCEVDNTEQLESALKLHLSYLPQQHALEVLEGDSDWIPVTSTWRPGPQPVIYTRMVPLQQSSNGSAPSASMVAANLALLQQLHQQLHQQMTSSSDPPAQPAAANAHPQTPRIGAGVGPWTKPPSLNGTLINGDNRRSLTGGPSSSNGGKDPHFTHQVWQGVVSLTGKYLDDGSQPEYELFEGVVEAQGPVAVTWPRRLLIGKLTSAVPMLMKLFENLSGRVGPLVQPFHMRITKRMPVLNGLLQSMRERNTVGIIQLEQHLMLLFAKGPDSFSVLLMPRSFSLASNPNGSGVPQMLQGAVGNGPAMPPSSGPQLPPLANLMTHLGMPPIPNTSLGGLGLQAQQAVPLQQQVNQAMNALLPSSMAMTLSIQQHQQQQQQHQQQQQQQQHQQQQQQLPASMAGHTATHTPQQMPTAMTQ